MHYMNVNEQITHALGIAPSADPKQLSALTLAYLRLVCAKGQAEAFYRLQPILTEEEQAAFRRGRNAHSATVPKNADVRDYRVATGLESLLGYLYCLGRDERIGELMHIALGKES